MLHNYGYRLVENTAQTKEAPVGELAQVLRHGSKLLLLGSLLVLSACNTTTVSNEWMGGPQALTRDNAMKRQGMMPVAISCLMDTSIKSPRPRYYLKLEYAPNPSRRGWYWYVGEPDEMQVASNTAKRSNLRLVQSKQMFDASTGKKGSCNIWHE